MSTKPKRSKSEPAPLKHGATKLGDQFFAIRLFDAPTGGFVSTSHGTFNTNTSKHVANRQMELVLVGTQREVKEFLAEMKAKALTRIKELEAKACESAQCPNCGKVFDLHGATPTGYVWKNDNGPDHVSDDVRPRFLEHFKSSPTLTQILEERVIAAVTERHGATPTPKEVRDNLSVVVDTIRGVGVQEWFWTGASIFKADELELARLEEAKPGVG